MREGGRKTARRGVWEILAFLVLLGVPSLVWLDTPFWDLPLELMPQALIMPLAFAVAVWAAEAVGGGGLRRIIVGSVALASGLALAYAIQIVRPDVAFSRAVLGIALILGLALFTLGVVAGGRVRVAALVVLGIGGGFVVASGARAGFEALTAPDAERTEIRITAYYPVAIARYDSVVALEDQRRGGGIARLGEDFLGMTGAGAFYRVSWDDAADSVTSRELPLTPPHNLAEFAAAVPPDVNREWFRTQDVATRRDGAGWEVFATHHHWDDAGGCLTLRLSRARLDAALETVREPWTTVFETRPCLPVGGAVRGVPFVGLESGGRLAWLEGGRLVLTTGDHQFDGWNRDIAAAQADGYDYGKTFIVDAASGRAELFTRGHRNPQGVYVDPAGRVWSTEHGPEGGDELNLLVEGGNYGWPYATYGTDYQRLVWPLAEADYARDAFLGPVYSWTPSIATSNLIGIEGDRFPRWRGDLLISSLAGRSLFRATLAGDRVVLIEPLPIGIPIRDLIEGPDGRIWLWGDYGEVIVIDVAEARSRGEAVFAACGACHSTNPRSGGLGPSLHEIIGRPVASKDDFDYSPALDGLDGRWTRERLDAFLADPGVFAPGTQMTFRLADPEDRAAVIEYLETLPP